MRLTWVAAIILAVVLVSYVVVTRAVADPSPAIAAEEVTVALDPDPLFLVPGGSGFMDVRVRGLDATTGLGGYHLKLTYDPSVVNVVNVEGGDPPFSASPISRIDNAGGEIELNATGAAIAAPGDLRLARLNITAVGPVGAGPALSFLKFSLVELARTTATGGPIPATGADGVVTTAAALVAVGRSSVPVDGFAAVPVTVDFNPAGGLGAYNISISFDPVVVQVDRIQGGNSPFGGLPTFQIDNVAGRVNIVGLQAAQLPGPTGEIAILRLGLTGVKIGSSSLEVTVKELVDAVAGDNWPTLPIDGSVEVTAAVSGPTPTPAIFTQDAPKGAPAITIQEAPLVSPQGYATPQQGAEFSSPSTSVIVQIPANSVREPVLLFVQELPREQTPRPPPTFRLGVVVELTLLDVSGNILPDMVLEKESTVAMRISSGDLVPTGPDGIVIQRYFPSENQWTALPTSVDIDRMVATATVTGFSVFALTIRDPSAIPTLAPVDGTPVLGPTPDVPITVAPPLPDGATATPLAQPTPIPVSPPAADGEVGALIWLLILIIVALVALLIGGAAVMLVSRR